MSDISEETVGELSKATKTENNFREKESLCKF